MMKRFYRWLMPRVGPGFPLHRFVWKDLPEDYNGLVVTSDIDKTYLQTKFDSLRGLLKIALESAEEKKAIPGMAPLLRAFCHAPGEPPLFFVSASPPQMRDVLQEKMALDGIPVAGITLKDPLRLARQRRWRHVRKHLLYKLTALLLNRADRPPLSRVQEILLGDDSESDAEIYLLYAKLTEGSLSSSEIEATFARLDAKDEEIELLMRLAQHPVPSSVVRIYIHRTTGKNPQDLPSHDPQLLLAARDSLQIGLDAHLRGWIKTSDLLGIAREHSEDEILASCRELLQRKLVSPETIDQIVKTFEGEGLV